MRWIHYAACQCLSILVSTCTTLICRSSAAQTALLSELRSKIEIIVGEKDSIVTPISSDIPVHIIAGAGHNPHITHVEAVYDYLTPF